MEILEKVKLKIEEINKQRESLLSDLRQDFAPMLKPIFDESKGKINSIGWTQYTPYFNDGDECVFGVHFNLDYGLYVNGEDLEESELFTVSKWGLNKYTDNDGSYEEWVKKYPEDRIDPKKNSDEIFLYGLIKEFASVLSSIDDEFYKDLFGDHVMVTVNSDGTVETEEYEHD